MATVKGVNRTIADATDADHTLAAGLFGGNVKVMTDVYEASAVAANDDIEMGGDLPIGARVLAVQLSHDALGSGVTLDVGDAEDVDRYIDGRDGATAGAVWGTLTDGIQYNVDETTPSTTDRQVRIRVLGAAATGTIKLQVFYTHD